MITLYHCHDARSFRPLWALEELGLGYELKMLSFPPRWRAREYLDLNPLGTVPLFIDGETRMTESAAILEFLAARYGGGVLSVGVEDPAFGDYLNALHFGEATLTFPQTLVLRYGRLEPEERRQPQVASDYARWFAGRAQGLRLNDGYVAGGRFTAADISVGYALLLAEELGLLGGLPPEVQAYWARLSGRDAYARARKVQEEAAATQGVPTVPLRSLGVQQAGTPR